MGGGARHAGAGGASAARCRPSAPRHHRGVILYELSRAADRAPASGAAALALAARGAGADARPRRAGGASCPAAARASGRTGRGGQAVERAWRTAPHPALARVCARARRRRAGARPGQAGSSGSRRRTPAPRKPSGARRGGAGGAALGRGAPPSRRRGRGRRRTPRPSRRLCLLMARLEESEHRRFGRGARMARPRRRRAARPALCLRQLRRRKPRNGGALPALRRFRYAGLAEPAAGDRAVAAPAGAASPAMLRRRGPRRPDTRSAVAPASGLAAPPQCG